MNNDSLQWGSGSSPKHGSGHHSSRRLEDEDGRDRHKPKVSRDADDRDRHRAGHRRISSDPAVGVRHSTNDLRPKPSSSRLVPDEVQEKRSGDRPSRGGERRRSDAARPEKPRDAPKRRGDTRWFDPREAQNNGKKVSGDRPARPKERPSGEETRKRERSSSRRAEGSGDTRERAQSSSRPSPVGDWQNDGKHCYGVFFKREKRQEVFELLRDRPIMKLVRDLAKQHPSWVKSEDSDTVHVSAILGFSKTFGNMKPMLLHAKKGGDVKIKDFLSVDSYNSCPIGGENPSFRSGSTRDWVSQQSGSSNSRASRGSRSTRTREDSGSIFSNLGFPWQDGEYQETDSEGEGSRTTRASSEKKARDGNKRERSTSSDHRRRAAEDDKLVRDWTKDNQHCYGLFFVREKRNEVFEILRERPYLKQVRALARKHHSWIKSEPGDTVKISVALGYGKDYPDIEPILVHAEKGGNIRILDFVLANDLYDDVRIGGVEYRSGCRHNAKLRSPTDVCCICKAPMKGSEPAVVFGPVKPPNYGGYNLELTDGSPYGPERDKENEIQVRRVQQWETFCIEDAIRHGRSVTITGKPVVVRSSNGKVVAKQESSKEEISVPVAVTPPSVPAVELSAEDDEGAWEDEDESSSDDECDILVITDHEAKKGEEKRFVKMVNHVEPEPKREKVTVGSQEFQDYCNNFPDFSEVPYPDPKPVFKGVVKTAQDVKFEVECDPEKFFSGLLGERDDNVWEDDPDFEPVMWEPPVEESVACSWIPDFMDWVPVTRTQMSALSGQVFHFVSAETVSAVGTKRRFGDCSVSDTPCENEECLVINEYHRKRRKRLRWTGDHLPVG